MDEVAEKNLELVVIVNQIDRYDKTKEALVKEKAEQDKLISDNMFIVK